MRGYRSFGVSLISGFEILFGGLFTLIVSIIQIYTLMCPPLSTASKNEQGYYNLAITGNYLGLAVTGSILLAGILTFALHKAGRILNLVLSSCCILIYIIIFVLSGTHISLFNFLTLPGIIFFTPLLLSIFLFWFFSLKSVKEAFDQ